MEYHAYFLKTKSPFLSRCKTGQKALDDIFVNAVSQMNLIGAYQNIEESDNSLELYTLSNRRAIKVAHETQVEFFTGINSAFNEVMRGSDNRPIPVCHDALIIDGDDAISVFGIGETSPDLSLFTRTTAFG